MCKYLFLFAIVVGSFACQKAQLAEYRKYASDADVPRISVEDAKKEVDERVAVIVDSRSEAAFKQEHIAGSINIMVGAPAEKFSELPKGKKIIVYCSWPAEHTSASLAFQMNQNGIANTYALLGGTQGWLAAGYPTEKSE